MSENNTEYKFESPLGKDPVEASDHQEQSEPEVQEQVSQEPQQQIEGPEKISLSKEEYDALAENANRYRTLQSNPKIVDVLRRHMLNDLNDTGDEGITSDGQENTNPDMKNFLNQVDTKFQKYEERLNAGEQLIRHLAMENFKLKNPDYTSMESEVQSIMKEHGANLPTAYEIARLRRASQNSQLTSSRNGVSQTAPTSETGRSGSVPSVESDFGDVEARILDRKATPSIDQAVDLAIEAARRQR